MFNMQMLQHKHLPNNIVTTSIDLFHSADPN